MPVPTPADIARRLPADGPLRKAFDDGVQQGRKEARQEVLTWLEKKYVDTKGPERGSPEARAMLQLAKELAEFLRPLDHRKAGRKSRRP